MYHEKFIVPAGEKISLADYDPAYTHHFKDESEANEKLQEDIKRLTRYQDVLFAGHCYSVLIVFQAMDAAGKDGAIKHVMSGLNPQGCQVYSFKAASPEELDHDFLWRTTRRVPERGHIGIFNRSYYEEVLVVRVHPEILEHERVPEQLLGKNLWEDRFEDIRNFERYLSRNGIAVRKFFLNVSKKEQKRRFLQRLENPEKNWKFSAADVRERACWDDYMKAYEEMIAATSSKHAPWYVVPADNKWYTRLVVAAAVVDTLKDLNLKYPTLDSEQRKQLLAAKAQL